MLMDSQHDSYVYVQYTRQSTVLGGSAQVDTLRHYLRSQGMEFRVCPLG